MFSLLTALHVKIILGIFSGFSHEHEANLEINGVKYAPGHSITLVKVIVSVLPHSALIESFLQ